MLIISIMSSIAVEHFAFDVEAREASFSIKKLCVSIVNHTKQTAVYACLLFVKISLNKQFVPYKISTS